MTSLTYLILKRAELPPPHEHTAMAVYAGHEAENRILLPLIRSLCEQLEAAEKALSVYAKSDMQELDEGFGKPKSPGYSAREALQRLEQFRKRMEK